MAPPAISYRHLHGFKHAIIITVVFILFLSMLPSKSGGSVIGSKPPTCLNKCMNCKPCMATLVVPNNQKRIKGRILESFRGDQDDDDTYYLLTWKCQCGNKLFQP
uniref:Epidermal patterning factor-like protein n=1 Tax=Cicer arietinum TaxID=3827 RepID=A0A1S2YMB6_CICAR|nr:EPIDERMAL PATTERNING FACTOR-like protein 8 [Cicer arietinum]